MYIIVDFAHNTYGNITCKINDYFLNINMLVDIICIFNTLYFRGFCIIPWIKMLNYTSISTKLS
jgi:hypothetical protein